MAFDFLLVVIFRRKRQARRKTRMMETRRNLDGCVLRGSEEWRVPTNTGRIGRRSVGRMGRLHLLGQRRNTTTKDQGAFDLSTHPIRTPKLQPNNPSTFASCLSVCRLPPGAYRQACNGPNRHCLFQARCCLQPAADAQRRVESGRCLQGEQRCGFFFSL